MSAHTTAHDDHSKEPRLYAAILVVLLILTGITVAASYVQFGSGMINVVIALTIATIKASLVGLFFMHLLHDKPLNAVILVSSLGFVGLLLITCYSDITTRDNPRPVNLRPVTAPATPGGAPAAGTAGAAAAPPPAVAPGGEHH